MKLEPDSRGVNTASIRSIGLTSRGKPFEAVPFYQWARIEAPASMTTIVESNLPALARSGLFGKSSLLVCLVRTDSAYSSEFMFDGMKSIQIGDDELEVTHGVLNEHNQKDEQDITAALELSMSTKLAPNVRRCRIPYRLRLKPLLDQVPGWKDVVLIEGVIDWGKPTWDE